MEFNQAEHSYRRNGSLYLPVTKFLERFKPVFAKEAIAQKCAIRDGREAQDVLDEWELNADVSRNYGTAVHQAIELWLKHGKIHKLSHVRKVVEAFAEKYPERFDIEPEIIVFLDEYKVAGTIDQLVKINMEERRVKVVDLKTNAELSEDAKGTFLAPLDKLPFSKINEYRLQLSCYKYMLEQTGWIVEGLELEHWDGDALRTIPLDPIDVAPLFGMLKGGTGSNINSKKVVKI